MRLVSPLWLPVPLAWEDLPSLTSAARWNTSNIQERLEKGNSPWSDYEASRQSIVQAIKTLGPGRKEGALDDE